LLGGVNQEEEGKEEEGEEGEEEKYTPRTIITK